MNLVNKENRDVVQSFILTTAKYDYSLHEKNILYAIIDVLQDYIAGLKLNQKYVINKTLYDDLDITLPISVFLKSEKDKNHALIKKSLLSLNSKIYKYETDKIITYYNIIERPSIIKNSHTISFRLAPALVQAFLDFSKGFSKYELRTAMSLGSVYSMRFYELMSGQKKPITYKIETLKSMFCLEEKYNRINDFLKRVIEPAKKELDDKSPYSFEYSMIKTGRKMTHIKFYPVYQEDKRDPNLLRNESAKQTSIYGWGMGHLSKYLIAEFGFTEQEIKNNSNLLNKAINHKTFDLPIFLAEQSRNAKTKKNPKGWIIGAVKKQMEQL